MRLTSTPLKVICSKYQLEGSVIFFLYLTTDVCTTIPITAVMYITFLVTGHAFAPFIQSLCLGRWTDLNFLSLQEASSFSQHLHKVRVSYM